MSRGRVSLDGQEYEIEEVLGSDSTDNGGRMVALALQRVVGDADREVFKLDLAESITEFNVGSMEKGDQNTILNVSGDTIDDEAGYLMDEVRAMEPGTAIVIVRRNT